MSVFLLSLLLQPESHAVLLLVGRADQEVTQSGFSCIANRCFRYICNVKDEVSLLMEALAGMTVHLRKQNGCVDVMVAEQRSRVIAAGGVHLPG